jgi:probable phosphoglycerate mutase
MKTLVLVQHCQSRHHLDRRVQMGPDRDNGLTDLGRRQAEVLAARICGAIGPAPCRLYSSDQTRALQTAEFLAGQLQQPVVPVPQLREYAADQLSDPLPQDGPTRPEDRTWQLFDSRPEPFLETWREFHQRVVAGMERIAREHPAECVPIVVSHGGTLSNIVAWWLRLPLDVLPERTCFAGSPGSISVLKANRFSNPVIGSLNDTSHLEVAGLGRGLTFG